MADIMDIILGRRSIRKYRDTPVPEELLNKVLEAGFYAPSAVNYQPWHFLVVDDRKVLEEIMEIQPYSKMLKQAPIAILVCGDLEKSEQFWIDDCAAATENILIAAHGLGLGTCWCGVAHTQMCDKMAEHFAMPQNIRPYSLIALGYPDEERPRPERVKPERIHRNKWE